MSPTSTGTRRRTRSTAKTSEPDKPKPTLKRKREAEEHEVAKKRMASPGGTPDEAESFEQMERTITLAQFSALLDTALDKRLATNRVEIAADFKQTMDEMRGRLDKNENSIAIHKRETRLQFDLVNKQLAALSAGLSLIHI